MCHRNAAIKNGVIGSNGKVAARRPGKMRQIGCRAGGASGANTGRELKKGPDVEVNLTQKLAAVEFRSPLPMADHRRHRIPHSSRQFQLEVPVTNA